MYKYPYLEQFYRDNYTKLLDRNSSLRPSKSCPKNGAAAVAKFVEFYQKTGSFSFSEKEVLKILNAENVEDGDTIFHQNLRVMREFGFVSVSNGASKTYCFTDQFIKFVDSKHSVECYILEKLLSITSVDDLTMYFNFLICVMREAAIYGQVILYRDSAEKFSLDVDVVEKRKEHQERIYKVYGFKGDEARNVPDNYTPNISYFCHAVLKQLGILTKSDSRIDNMGTLVLTPLGELILSKIDENIKFNQDATSNYPKKNIHNVDLLIPLQQIFYGAPGTGKSHTIQERTEHEDVIRTTFHPDTDYSTFVGAYKPTTIDAPVMTVIGTKAVPVENEDGSPRIEPKIIYEFVNQAFLQAYVKAWEKYSKGGFDNAQKQFLVIEEINRGNCAQIFGDLFQLLDRNDAGFSDYPIKADADMAKQLKKQLKGLTIEDPDTINSLYKGENIVSQVLNGELLLLPKNLYIWATMNTSDQSLFPIDSAFKRRWDWQYMPIANGFENWYISIEDYKFDWWQFLQKINKLIGATTHSEDKKLGYYFCKAKNKEIDANLFVSKVIFYLWNDVFKDYEFANSVFDDIDGKKLTFDKFYTTINGNTIVVEDKVVMFLNKLDEAIDKEYSMLLPNAEATTGLSGNDFTNYSFEGSAPMGKSALGKAIILKYLNENAGLTFDEIKAKFPDSLLGSVASKGLIVKDEEDLGSYQRYYVGGFNSADGVKFKIYKQWTVDNIQNIISFAFSLGWSVEEKGSWRRKDNNA